MFPALGKKRPRNAFRRSIRGDFFDPGTDASGTGASKLAIQAGFRPPFACTPQPFKAEPHSGLGRLPKAPRVDACEAWPRAQHPTGLGYPAPAKLSLCPTSVTPLEAPLTGQDTTRISEVVGTGIGIHSQVRERRFAALKSMLLSGDCKKLSVILRRSPRSGEPRRIGRRRDAKTAPASILRDARKSRAPQDDGGEMTTCMPRDAHEGV